MAGWLHASEFSKFAGDGAAGAALASAGLSETRKS